MKVMTSRIKILKPFIPLLERKYTYYVYASGRGCGKSDNIEACLILLARQFPIRILCVREYQSSIAESVKSNLEALIDNMGLRDFFYSTEKEINGTNGSKFIFRGLRNSNAVNIKSISDIKITFIEEAEALSEKSWEILVPSVMRSKDKDNIIVAALNPNFEEDVIWDRFFVKEPPQNSFVCKLSQKDNPFFFETDLVNQMEHDRKILPYSQFAHKWLGELQTAEESCLFTKEAFDLMKQVPDSWQRSDYVRLVIGVDPAMTNKDFSNQFGICVVGVTTSGEFHCLGNYTDNHTPHTFSIAVKDLYRDYNADAVVVETNAGGDFLKSTLLLADATMNIVEVRATKDKMTRALPIANLASLGMVRLFDLNRNQLIRQMKCSTILGYRGPSGESPDALDALCWAIYELGRLLENEQEKTVFSSEMFQANSKDYPFSLGNKHLFTFATSNEGCIITFCVNDNKLNEHCITILKTEVLPLKDFFEEVNSWSSGYAYVQDDDNMQFSSNTLSYYTPELLKIDEVVSSLLTLLPNIKIDLRYACEASRYKGFNGNILENELYKFKFETQKDNVIIRTFSYLVKELS